MLQMRNGAVLKLGNGAQLKPTTPPRAIDLNLMSHGDSISNGNYLQVCGALILTGQDLNPKVTPRGLSGNSFNYDFGNINGFGRTLLEDAPLAIDPRQIPGIPNWLMIFAGTNGLALQHISVATEIANFEQYLTSRLAAGWVADRIIVGTMLPRQVDLIEARADYNGQIVSLASTYGYRVARFDLDPDIGGDGDNLNTTYYAADTVHPIEAGFLIMGGIVYEAMFPV